MLTMWVGLANGYVAAYAVNLVKNPSKNPSSGKRIELVPTRKCLVDDDGWID